MEKPHLSEVNLEKPSIVRLLLLVFADVLDGEAEHVVVGDGVRDDVFVQALIEDVLSCNAAQAVFRKDRRPREPEKLRLLEESLDALVSEPELAAVTLVEDDDDLLVGEWRELLQVGIPPDGDIELLDGGDDEFPVSCWTRLRVLLVPSTAPSEKELNSLVVWISRSLRSTTKSTFLTSGISERI